MMDFRFTLTQTICHSALTFLRTKNQDQPTTFPPCPTYEMLVQHLLCAPLSSSYSRLTANN